MYYNTQQFCLYDANLESNRGSCGFYISLKSHSIKDPAVSLMVAIGQEMVREKILQGQGKVKF